MYLNVTVKSKQTGEKGSEAIQTAHSELRYWYALCATNVPFVTRAPKGWVQSEEEKAKEWEVDAEAKLKKFLQN